MKRFEYKTTTGALLAYVGEEVFGVDPTPPDGSGAWRVVHLHTQGTFTGGPRLTTVWEREVLGEESVAELELLKAIDSALDGVNVNLDELVDEVRACASTLDRIYREMPTP